MSVTAHTSINQANLASVQLNTEPAVTSISVSARIDYIQRFSKQAVLVVDQDAAIYAQAARQFLINLSKEKSDQEANVAFVSASTKLNDIQMRCRLIEQLYANTLFDPEKSLAVSILNLSKQSKDSITIVVENAQSLSLQIKYELCQLVDIANKTQGRINVALFGLEVTAKDISSNKSIFKNKLAIVDAQSGQLLALDHPKFKEGNSFFDNKFWLRFIAVTATIATVIGLSWAVMINYDNFSLSKLPLLTTESNKVANKDNVKMIVTSQIEQEPTATDELNENKANKIANSTEIQAALLGDVLETDIKLAVPADTNDILQALNFEEKIVSKELIEELKEPISDEGKLSVDNTAASLAPLDLTENVKVTPLSKPVPIQKKIDSNERQMTVGLNQSYYLNESTGYVVQLVGFTDLALLTRFIQQYPELETFAYQKQLNDQTFFVLTTKIFESKVQAQEAMTVLPQNIIDRGVWIKPLSTVKDEINKS